MTKKYRIQYTCGCKREVSEGQTPSETCEKHGAGISSQNGARIRSLVIRFHCFIGSHNWTCAAEEGIKPTKKQLKNGVTGFQEYGIMYCKHCRKVSTLSSF